MGLPMESAQQLLERQDSPMRCQVHLRSHWTRWLSSARSTRQLTLPSEIYKPQHYRQRSNPSVTSLMAVQGWIWDEQGIKDVVVVASLNRRSTVVVFDALSAGTIDTYLISLCNPQDKNHFPNTRYAHSISGLFCTATPRLTWCIYWWTGRSFDLCW